MTEHLALRYAGLGWKVLPCWPKDKVGCLAWDQASSDPAVIRHWLKGDLVGCDDPKRRASFRRQFARCNWGVVCGRASGIVVLDAERQAAARQLPGIFEAAGSEFPRAPTVETGGWTAGQHVYFAWPSDGRELRGQFWLRNDIEVRASKLLCLLPPSVHPDTGNRYQWLAGHSPFYDTVTLPELPPWLAELMAPVPVPERRELTPEEIARLGDGERALAWAVEHVSRTGKGSRNTTLFHITCWLRDLEQSIPAARIREAMQQAGRAAGLPPRRVDPTVNSALKNAN